MPDFEDVITDLRTARAAGEARLAQARGAAHDALQRARAAADPQSGAAATVPVAQSMLTIGAVVLGVSTVAVDRLRRRTEYRWPSQERVGRRPALQSLGPGADTITLDGVIFPAYRGRPSVVRDALRQAAAAGAPLVVTDATGAVYGKWCVVSVEESRSGLYADGAPRKVEWTVELSHYGDDAPTGRLDGIEDAAAEAGDVRAMVDALEAAASDGADAVRAAAQKAGGGANPASNLRRVADAVAGAARGAGASDLIDAAVGAAGRLPGSPILPQVARVAYRARAGDTLSTIAALRYGSADAVGSLLEANPGLAALDPSLPAGTLVGLPEKVELLADTRRAVRLWT